MTSVKLGRGNLKKEINNVYDIFDFFLAIASSTAFNCFNNSSLLDGAPLFWFGLLFFFADEPLSESESESEDWAARFLPADSSFSFLVSELSAATEAAPVTLLD